MKQSMKVYEVYFRDKKFRKEIKKLDMIQGISIICGLIGSVMFLIFWILRAVGNIES